MTTDLDRLSAQALPLSTAAALLDNATRTAGALCMGVDRHGFDREVTRGQLVVLADMREYVIHWLGAVEPAGGNLEGLGPVLADAAEKLGFFIEDMGTALAFGSDLPDDWPDRLDDIANQTIGVVRKVNAALTLADAPTSRSN